MALDPSQYLPEGETVLLQERRHTLSILDSLLATVVGWLVLSGIALGVFVGAVPDLMLPVGVPVLAALFLLAAAFSTAAILRTKTSLATVTDRGVYHSYGHLRFVLAQTTFDRVTDLHVRQGIFGRWNGFGTVTVMTAGSGITLAGIRDPFGAKSRIEAAREAHIRRLVSAHTKAAKRTAGMASEAGMAASVAAPGGASAAFAASAAPGSAVSAAFPMAQASSSFQPWSGRPAPAQLVVDLVPFGVALVVGGAVMAIGLVMGQNQIVFLPGFFILVSGLTAVRSVIRHKTARYEVDRRGVAVSGGWLGRTRAETTFEKVTDVTVEQGIIARLVGVGKISINTAGGSGAPILFEGVRDPEGVKAILDAARRAGR